MCLDVATRRHCALLYSFLVSLDALQRWVKSGMLVESSDLCNKPAIHRIQKVYYGILVLECTDEQTSSFSKVVNFVEIYQNQESWWISWDIMKQAQVLVSLVLWPFWKHYHTKGFLQSHLISVSSKSKSESDRGSHLMTKYDQLRTWFWVIKSGTIGHMFWALSMDFLIFFV